MTTPNRQQRRSSRPAEPVVQERTNGEPVVPERTNGEPVVPAKRPWHIGPKVDRVLYIANLTPQGCGLVLLFVATLAVVAMAAAAWLRP